MDIYTFRAAAFNNSRTIWRNIHGWSFKTQYANYPLEFKRMQYKRLRRSGATI